MKSFLLSLNIFSSLQKKLSGDQHLAAKALLSVLSLYLLNALWEGFKQNLSGLDIDTEFITLSLRNKAVSAAGWFKQLFKAKMEEKGCYLSQDACQGLCHA